MIEASQPSFNERLQRAFAAADHLGLSPQRQANVFGKRLQPNGDFEELRTKLATGPNEEVARRAECIVTIAAQLDALCKTKTGRKKMLYGPIQRLGGRKLIEMITSESVDDVLEATGFLEGMTN